jgi:hypothetical protein
MKEALQGVVPAMSLHIPLTGAHFLFPVPEISVPEASVPETSVPEARDQKPVSG